MKASKIRIVVDGMGGDFAPAEIINGVIGAANARPEARFLVTGPAARLSHEFATHGTTPSNVEIIDAPSVIEMAEESSRALRTKRDSSIVVGVELVKQGRGDAFISAGNTGAATAAALLTYGRVAGVKRPAIAVVLPSQAGRFVLLDAGATADCKPEYLVQFARMGTTFSRLFIGVAEPRVGLLNIGGEAEKGSALYKETHQMLKAAGLNFVGNVEGREMFRGGADVVVADGFTGNVVLKVVEGAADNIFAALKEGVSASLRSKLGGWLLAPVFKGLKRRMDPEEVGGQLLLGVNGICVISHGGSNAKAIRSAIDVAATTVEVGLIADIARDMGHGDENTEA